LLRVHDQSKLSLLSLIELNLFAEMQAYYYGMIVSGRVLIRKLSLAHPKAPDELKRFALLERNIADFIRKTSKPGGVEES
jgi:hypothetical protein